MDVNGKQLQVRAFVFDCYAGIFLEYLSLEGPFASLLKSLSGHFIELNTI